MCFTDLHQPAELLDIHPETSGSPEVYGLSFRIDKTFSRSLIEVEKGSAKIRTGFTLPVVRPEQGSQGVAAMALLCDHQIAE